MSGTMKRIHVTERDTSSIRGTKLAHGLAFSDKYCLRTGKERIDPNIIGKISSSGYALGTNGGRDLIIVTL